VEGELGTGTGLTITEEGAGVATVEVFGADEEVVEETVDFCSLVEVFCAVEEDADVLFGAAEEELLDEGEGVEGTEGAAP